MSPRRKSLDSSSSSSDSSRGGDKKYKAKKDKKEKKDKKDKKDKDHKYMSGSHSSTHTPGPAAVSQFAASHGFNPEAHMSPPPGFGDHHQQEKVRLGGEFLVPHSPSLPPSYQDHPPSGFRLPLSATAPFPDPSQTGQPPFYDADGVSPVFIGSALLEGSVHPCKIGPHLQPFASVPYGGGEYGHHGRFDLLPFKPDQMEFVHTSRGVIPPGRRPIEGGYEQDGNKLYHAVAVVNGAKVPGKTGEHLRGSRVAFGGTEYEIDDNYEILCWR